MGKAADRSEKPAKTAALSPPSWMSRPEKREFLRLIDARKAADKPVLPGELGALCDFVTVRTRIAALRKMSDAAFARAGDFVPAQRHAAAIARQLDTTTSLSRRLARDLRLAESD